jgi:predicted methyltransferase
MRLVFSALWIAFFALLGPARAESADTALSAAIDGAWREPQSRARDAYRHPYESLTFWGLKPGMTVIEVDPGVRGWWTEILAPYARATGAHTLRPRLIARSPAPRRKVPMPRTPPFGRASRTSPSSARSKRTTSAHSIQTPFLPDQSTSFWWRGPV